MDCRIKSCPEVEGEMEKKTNRILNVSGLAPPQPILITTKTLEALDHGERIEVISTDKWAKKAIPSLCEKGKYSLIETKEKHGLTYFVIEKD